jgi:hypothetical protein
MVRAQGIHGDEKNPARRGKRWFLDGQGWLLATTTDQQSAGGDRTQKK